MAPLSTIPIASADQYECGEHYPRAETANGRTIRLDSIARALKVFEPSSLLPLLTERKVAIVRSITEESR
jgi:hypothetical protein